QTLAIMEAMKMEHAIGAPHDGIVAEVCVAEGDQVDEGAVLVIVREEGAERADDD
ncbi:MAG: acetyl-CoA carboxylase biotin carboxyl carrier protein subunit, partial [Myxococcales bacterium]|nr:acetyl-CoA carboxylase biotin carboxyl carrier protein subunit [Myxococcales bacterium]